MTNTSGDTGANGAEGSIETKPAAVDVAALSAYAGKRGCVLYLGMDADELGDVLASAILIVPNA